MIKVTKLNGREFFLNAEHIQFVEETPDTVITLVNNERITVKEPSQEVVRKVIEYMRTIRGFGPLTGEYK